MKNLFIAIMFLALIISLVLFQNKANADIILKGGTAISDTQEPHTNTWLGIWGETNNCEYCMALFVVETYRKENDQPKDRIVGVDYVIKSFVNEDGAIRTNLGFALTEEPLNGGEQFNFHFGLSMEAKKAIMGKYSLLFSYDHFSNGMTLFDRDHIKINKPLDLMAIGIGF